MIDMTRVTMTGHLYRFFPQLEDRDIRVTAGSVADILKKVNQIAPGFIDYVLDDQGSLRKHVNICIEDSMIVDRKSLSDQVRDGETLFIFQALSGG